MSLVSIIIPYFKKKNHIKLTIKSILNQRYKNIEIIIIYDNSNKNELKFIEKIKKLDKRIQIIVNNKNIGAGASRNKAIKKSKGKYIAFLDADDLWRPKKLQKQISYMKKNNIDISHTSYSIINDKNKVLSIRKANNLNFNDLVKSCDIGLSTVVLKKKILRNTLFANLKTKEDYVLWLKLAKKGFKFYGIKENLTSWRKTPDSLSSSIVQKMIDGYRVYRIHLRYSLIKSLTKLIQLSFNYLKKNG